MFLLKGEIMSSLPFVGFGLLLTRARKSLGFTAKSMAEQMQLELADYENIERGQIPPSAKQLTKLAQILKRDLSEIALWLTRKSESTGSFIRPQTPSRAYLEEYENTVKRVQDMAKAWKWEASQIPSFFFEAFKDKLLQLSSLPVLPETVLLLEEIIANNPKSRKLSEVIGLFGDGESQAQFIARDAAQGLFLTRLSNQIYLKDHEEQNPEKNMSQLSIGQFEGLYLSILLDNGIYDNFKNLAFLQQQSEFASLAALMCRLLSPHVSGYIDPEKLYRAVLAQNVGEFALFVIINELEKEWKRDGVTPDILPAEFVSHWLYEAHHVVSAILAKRWNCDVQVCDEILHHHERSADDDCPMDGISPFGMTMKMIAWYTDNGFNYVSEAGVSRLLEQYPQIKIDPQNLYDVCFKMFSLRQNLLEVSSAVLMQSIDTDIFAKKKISETTDALPRHRIVRQGYRYSVEYQQAVIVQAKNLVYEKMRGLLLGVDSSINAVSVQDIRNIVEKMREL